MLAFILIHKVGDTLANLTFRLLFDDLGFTNDEIAFYDVGVGFWAYLIGIFVGGVLYAKMGMKRSVLLSLVLMAVSNLSFAALAGGGAFQHRAWPARSASRISPSGFGGVAVVAYFSALTDLRFTAAQYALISAAASIVGRFVTGTTAGGLIETFGYVNFYLLTTVIALPGVFLFWWMIRSGLVDRSIGSAGGGDEAPPVPRDSEERRSRRRHDRLSRRPGDPGDADHRRDPQRAQSALDHGADASCRGPSTIAYLVIEVYPRLRGNRHVRTVRARAVAAAIDPERGGAGGARCARPGRIPPPIASGSADALAALGRYGEALPLLHEAIERGPADMRTGEKLARAQFETDDPASALATLDANPPASAQSDRATGKGCSGRVSSMRWGAREGSLALYADLVTRLPGEEGRCRYAGLLLEQGWDKKARVVLEEVEARMKRLDRQQRAAEADMYRWAMERLGELRAGR